MSNVLNPMLYRRLKRKFGEVKVSNEGEALDYKVRTNPVTNKPYLDFIQRGEQYRVACPYCLDTRFRLYISHRWGQRDTTGRKMTFLAKCFNENCLTESENWRDFIETLENNDDSLEQARVLPGEKNPEAARTVKWPGPCKRLDELPEEHKARAYLRSRDFDPDVISRLYGVCYCEDSHHFSARNRIIIPVYDKEAMKGWQARFVGELPWKDPKEKRGLPPKYFSCPNSQFRSQCIYNWDRMKQWSTGIICEGPMDVWRFGVMAGCIFGNTMTDVQKRKVAAVFKRRTLVLLLDPEESESRSTERTVEWFEQRMPGQFAAVKLPKGTDPGSLEREFLREIVRVEAAKQGVKVRYAKWRK